MIGRFDDHFVRADAVHAIEQAFAFAIQAAFNSQRRKFIGDHAERPTRRILAAAVASIGENFGGRLPFISGAKGTKGGPLIFDALADEIHGRLARSVEIMTQRPVIGSLRSSGKRSS